MDNEEKQRTANSRFAKAGVSCFYESEVLNLSFVLLMKFRAKNPRLRKAANRYIAAYGYAPFFKYKQNPNLSIGISSITSLNTFFFVSKSHRIDRLLNRL